MPSIFETFNVLARYVAIQAVFPMDLVGRDLEEHTMRIRMKRNFSGITAADSEIVLNEKDKACDIELDLNIRTEENGPTKRGYSCTAAKVDREHTTQIMIEDLSMPVMYTVFQTTLLMDASCRTTGIVVHSGNDFSGTVRKMKRWTKRGYSCTTAAEREIVPNVKEKPGRIALEFDESRERITQITIETSDVPVKYAGMVQNEASKKVKLEINELVRQLRKQQADDVAHRDDRTYSMDANAAGRTREERPMMKEVRTLQETSRGLHKELEDKTKDKEKTKVVELDAKDRRGTRAIIWRFLSMPSLSSSSSSSSALWSSSLLSPWSLSSSSPSSS